MNWVECFLSFLIGIFFALTIAFLFRAKFITVIKVLVNSTIAMILIIITIHAGDYEVGGLSYLLCGALGIFGYPFVFFVF